MGLEGIFRNGRAAFMPYLCCGDPSAEFTVKAAKALAAGGADAIELGIPFSDPVADGRSLQAASARALGQGMTPARALGTVREVAEAAGLPLIAMTYCNIVLANGGESYIRKLKEAGADGLIVPDVPLEESAFLQEGCRKAGISLVRMASPSCGDERLRAICGAAEGFIYAVGALGTTGARASLGNDAAALVGKVKRITSLPVAAGFGISKPGHAAALAGAGADGIIVGSAIADAYAAFISGDGIIREEEALSELEDFARRMKSACVTRH